MVGDSVERSASSPASKTALARAVRAVAREIDKLFQLEPGGSGRAEAYLATMGAKITMVLDGQEDPEAVRDWLASSPYCQPLFDALVAEMVSWPPEPDTAAATLGALRASLACRPPSVFGGWGHGDDEEGLRERMSGPGAFDLLVEVAHDFRSPLGSILFLSEALRDGHGGPLTEGQRSQLGLIYSAAFGLSSIASDIMDVAKREKKLIESEPVPYSPAEVFRNVERLVRPIVEEKRLELRIVVPERWQAKGHPHALSRVLLNLTTNALKFTDEGTVEIGVKALPHANLEYYVHDTGRGMSAEQQSVLFQPFQRRSARSEDGHHFSGSGIGLSIARRLVAAMGSELRLDSSDEAGTRFSFKVGRQAKAR